MPVSTERKQKVIGAHRAHDRDTGSAAVQIALLTDRINSLTDHFKAHVKDHNSRRGLLKLVGQRRKLLEYLRTTDGARYGALIKELGIRK